MSDMIVVERNPAEERLDELGVKSWPIWEKEVSEFPWCYDMDETCYFLAGEVEVVPEGGEPVRMGAGDLVTFKSGLSCSWKISVPVRKHYNFS